MRVLHVYKDVYPPVVGGIERHIDSLRLALPDIRQDVIACSRTVRTVRRRGTPPRDEELLVGELGRVLSVPISPGFPCHAACYGAGAVVHVHMPNPTGELSALLTRRRAGLLATYHADIVRQKRYLALYEPLVRRCLRACDEVIVASNRMATESPMLTRCGVSATVVPYGIDVGPWGDPDAREVAALRRQHGPHVLAAGRLVYYKGFDRLVDVAAEIPWRIVIVGNGPERPALEEQIRRNGLSEKVHLAGYVSDATLAAHLAAANIFVLPSVNRAEAFGIALLEAQAAGLPVVVTDTGSGTVEAFAPGETGILVPPDDRPALAVAINRLIADDGERERMGRAARCLIAERHSLEALAERMRPIYAATWSRR
jgi:glycosyltransferase involved in cell wall biosynthesis